MNTMRTQRVVWPLALLATAFLWACQEASGPTGLDSSTTVPNFGHNPNAPPVHGGGGGGGESPKVVLSGNYASSGLQDISFQENGRRVIVRTEDGAQIQYSVTIDLPFDVLSCVWSGFDNAGDAFEFWDTFPFADAESKNLLFRVNKKAEGLSDGEHRTEARWWIEDTERVMYLVKVGVPGKVLADQLSELIDDDFVPATGTIDGTTVTITGGAIRLSRHECGDLTELTAGCGPQAPTQEVACINPTSGDLQQVFIATVTIP